MATVVFCENCRREKNWPKPSVRVTTDACDVCGGWDAYDERKVNPRTQKVKIRRVKLKNFEHDARFLPGLQQEARLQEPLA